MYFCTLDLWPILRRMCSLCVSVSVPFPLTRMSETSGSRRSDNSVPQLRLSSLALSWTGEVRIFVWIISFTSKILVNPPTVSPYKSNIISEDMGRKLSKELKAAFYHECSSLTREGVERLFHDAIDLVVSKKQRKRKVHESCILLWFENIFLKYFSRLCFSVVTCHKSCNKSWQSDILVIALHAKYFFIALSAFYQEQWLPRRPFTISPKL